MDSPVAKQCVSRWTWLFLGLALTLLLTACADDDPVEPAGEADAPAETFVVGVAWAELSSSYFIGMRDAVDRYADEIDDLEVIHVQADEDQARQLDQIDELLSQDIDLLVVSAIESDAAVPGIRTAHEAGVQIITLDRPASEAQEEGLLVTHVGASAELAGYLQGRYVCEEVSDTARLLGIWGPPGDETSRDRIEGLNRAMEEEDCTGIEVVSEDYARTNSPEESADQVQDWLQIYGPGEIDAIVSYGDHLSSAALQILRAEQRDDIVVLGTANFGDFPVAICDGDAQAVATVDFDLDGQGRTLIDTIQQVRQGQADEIGDWVVTPAVIVTEENCQDFPPM